MSSVIAATVSSRLAVEIAARIAGVQPVHVGEEDQQVRVDEVGHERGEIVVVADLDLVHRHRVVLVHDRQHVEVEQGEQRVPRVEIAAAVAMSCAVRSTWPT